MNFEEEEETPKKVLKSNKSFKNQLSSFVNKNYNSESYSHFKMKPPQKKKSMKKKKQKNVLNQRTPYNNRLRSSRISSSVLKSSRTPKLMTRSIKASNISQKRGFSRNMKGSVKRKTSIINTRTDSNTNITGQSNKKPVEQKMIYVNQHQLNANFRSRGGILNKLDLKTEKNIKNQKSKLQYSRKNLNFETNEQEYGSVYLNNPNLRLNQLKMDNEKLINDKIAEYQKNVNRYKLGTKKRVKIMLPSANAMNDYEAEYEDQDRSSSSKHFKYKEELRSDLLSQAQTVNMNTDSQITSYNNNHIPNKFESKHYQQDYVQLHVQAIKNQKKQKIRASESSIMLKNSRMSKKNKKSKVFLDQKDFSNPYGFSSYEQSKKKYNQRMGHLQNPNILNRIQTEDEQMELFTKSKYKKNNYRDNYQNRFQSKYQERRVSIDSDLRLRGNTDLNYQKLIHTYDDTGSRGFNIYSGKTKQNIYRN